MMDSESVITGFADLQKQLDMLAPNIEKKLLRGALRAGQAVVAEVAKSKVPASAPSSENQKLYGGYAGALRDSIRVSTTTRGGKITAKVTAGNKVAYYARFVEFGTAAHVINATKGSALSFGGKEYASLNHPGARMHPFMRPALDMASNGNSAALIAVAEYMKKRITKELDKLPDQTDGKGGAK
jgi:HK97 gp10 family phage protein